ncbi:hypothetical protein CDV36_012583 [Fusarium kuroshium]|uniref:Uncharacterized protein n=2 Tax=Fusarium solani species complex TaxID=232080 RepID=A0A3M2RR55_9HYPO|nr:hypothetical protein CDV36_012583 [Fusarium kuroshium]RSL79321.1 hypothetical protein CEP51_007466 [Fusarium floridanum]
MMVSGDWCLADYERSCTTKRMAGQPGRSQPSSALDAAQPHAQGNILQFVFANNQARTGVRLGANTTTTPSLRNRDYPRPSVPQPSQDPTKAPTHTAFLALVLCCLSSVHRPLFLKA